MTQDNNRGLYRLMDRYIDGDRRAFSELHRRLSPRLRGLLMKLVRNESAVDDLSQLTFIKAHLARDRFEPREGNPDGAVVAWYFAIGRNVGLDHLRSQTRQRKRAASTSTQDRLEELADLAPSVEEAAASSEDEREIISRVHDALAQLPEGQREVVQLHKLEGMSMAEVAERLRIREGAARVRAHRGYRALARLLGAAHTILALTDLADLGPWSGS